MPPPVVSFDKYFLCLREKYVFKSRQVSVCCVREIASVHRVVHICYTRSEFRRLVLLALYVPLGLEIGLLQTNFSCDSKNHS